MAKSRKVEFVSKRGKKRDPHHVFLSTLAKEITENPDPRVKAQLTSIYLQRKANAESMSHLRDNIIYLDNLKGRLQKSGEPPLAVRQMDVGIIGLADMAPIMESGNISEALAHYGAAYAQRTAFRVRLKSKLMSRNMVKRKIASINRRFQENIQKHNSIYEQVKAELANHPMGGGFQEQTGYGGSDRQTTKLNSLFKRSNSIARENLKLQKYAESYIGSYLEKYARHELSQVRKLNDAQLQGEIEKLRASFPNTKKSLDSLFKIGEITAEPGGLDDTIDHMERTAKFQALFVENIVRQLNKKTIPDTMVLLRDKLGELSTHTDRFQKVADKIAEVQTVPMDYDLRMEKLAKLGVELMVHYYPMRFTAEELSTIFNHLNDRVGEKKASQLLEEWEIDPKPIFEKIKEAHKAAFGHGPLDVTS